MAKARSPEYPAIGLKDAVDKIKLVYDKDYQNKLPKRVVAEHMGYKGLNGGSLPILAALGKYGLLEGRGDDTRVSDMALTIIAHAPGTDARIGALSAAASSPELFSELDEKFQGGKASDAAIRSYLLTQKFIPAAADTAIRTYRETKQFVEAELAGYSEPPKQEAEMKHADTLPVDRSPSGLAAFAAAKRLMNPPERPLMLQEVFNLDEGPVTLTVPSTLSKDSFEELEAHFQLFLRRARRRALGRAVAEGLANIDADEAERWSDAEKK